MKKVFSLVMAVLLVAAALPALADHGQYMQDNVGYAQKGLPGVLERFDGDLDAVEAYLTSPTASQQGGGTGKRTDLPAPVKIAKPADDSNEPDSPTIPSVPGSERCPFSISPLNGSDQENLNAVKALFEETGVYGSLGDSVYFLNDGTDTYKVTISGGGTVIIPEKVIGLPG